MAEETRGSEERSELRLALGMRGGVSLAVWIGGACAEIDDLRKATRGGDDFWSKLLTATNYERVVVDVMAGASAGGLNGVLFAAAIRHAFSMKDLFDDVWRKVAAVDDLRRSAPPWLSLFDGDTKFLAVVQEVLVARCARLPTDDPAPDPADRYIDLQLSATLVEPIAIGDNPDLGSELEEYRRFVSSARFHFRHDPGAAVSKSDLDGPEAMARLALAARSTSSFPGAFEAAVVRSTRPPAFGQRSVGDSGPRPRLTDCHGVFSHSRGPVSVDPEILDQDFVVADGGIVDNIPLGKAIDAIESAPATGPTTRYLLYLHPTGPPPPAGTSPGDDPVDATRPSHTAAMAARRGLWNVGKGFFAARFESESIVRDLEQLELHNRAVQRAAIVRQSTASQLCQLGVRDLPTAVRQTWGSYSFQRPALEAAEIRRLLDDPVAFLGEDPFPYVDDDSRWKGPLNQWWDRDLRQSLDTDLAAAIEKRLSADLKLLGTRLPDEEGVLLRADLPLLAIGLGPLRRLLSLLLEWVRSLPPSPERDLRKGELYGLASLVALLERVHRLGWVVLAGQAAGIDELKAWCARSLGLLDRFFLIDRQLADRLVDLDSESVDGYLGACNAALQGLIGGGIGIPPWPTAAFEDAAAPLGVAPSDLRVVLRDRIVALVRPLIGPPLPLPTDEDGFASAAGLLEYVLTYVGLDLEARLGVLETLCLPEFLAGKPGLAQIRSFRLSAAAETPWASDFTELYAKSRQIDRDGPGKGRPPDGWRTSPDFLRPSVKLAGNELGNFSAFFDPNWRANDWMWGRLDAASGLVDILLAQYRFTTGLPPSVSALAGDGAEPLAVRRRLIAERQAQILQEELGDDWRTKIATHRAGLDTLTDPGSRQLQHSAMELASIVPKILEAMVPGKALKRTASSLGPIVRLATWRFARPNPKERHRAPTPKQNPEAGHPGRIAAAFERVKHAVWGRRGKRGR